jgi:transcriptional repressor NrdR
MKCVRCNCEDTKVVESREVTGGVSTRRRRECCKCQTRFTTYERVEQPQVVVVKNDGNRELFSREKLLKGLLRATEKTPVTTVDLEVLIASIESKLQASNETEVQSKLVGEMVMEGLAGLSEVAYVRFASVYRKFKDISGFENELKKMRDKHEKLD